MYSDSVLFIISCISKLIIAIFMQFTLTFLLIYDSFVPILAHTLAFHQENLSTCTVKTNISQNVLN